MLSPPHPPCSLWPLRSERALGTNAKDPAGLLCRGGDSGRASGLRHEREVLTKKLGKFIHSSRQVATPSGNTRGSAWGRAILWSSEESLLQPLLACTGLPARDRALGAGGGGR